jgi:mannose/fructose-specific phosphotransferase system component IIA
MIPNTKPARALVITHGAIGVELKNVVEMILGPTEGLEAMTNSGKSGEEITRDVTAWLEEPSRGDENGIHPGLQSIILIDDYGGSCATAAQLAAKDIPNVAIISGVNLAMLLGFVTWRDSSDFDELVRKIVQKGREAITMLGSR